MLSGMWIKHRHAKICEMNQDQLYSAALSVALETKKRYGDVILNNSFAWIFPNGRIPTCPSGGSYTMNRFGDVPVCSHHGDLLKLSGPLGPKEAGIGVPNR